MRLLFINEYAGYFGGVEQNIAHTCRALRSRGHSVYLAYRAATEKNFLEYSQLFTQIFPCKELGAPEGESLVCLIQDIQPDSVYVHRVESIEPFLGLDQKVTRMIPDHDLCCPRRH